MDDELRPGDKGRLLFEKRFGVVPDVVTLPGAGSDRRYYRMSAPGLPTVIATEGDDAVENKAFVSLSAAFRASCQKVPEIIACDDDYGCYLQEDLGDRQLLEVLSSDERIPLAEKVMESLVSLQTVPEAVWKGHVAARDFSERQVMWDLNYYKYEFLRPAGIGFDEELLEDDFCAFASRMTHADRRLCGFMYRDFQSRNVMIRDGEPWWIDYQGGRKGPLLYDAVSFLWQAKARFSEEERRHLLSIYASALSRVRKVEVESILSGVDDMALLRTLQVLGAYGFRGLVEKKSHFIESIPGALENLRKLIWKGTLDCYPELKKVCMSAVSSRFAVRGSGGTLVVKVFSFSYKRGYPEDLTGNGGGFMFDCRGMHNPGRYERYKSLTGLDRDVKEFLEERGEVKGFVDKAMGIVSPSVARYLERGFSSLQVGFGCTGGRHRSVYCAQAFGEKVAALFPDARVEIIHREQGQKTVLNNREI